MRPIIAYFAIISVLISKVVSWEDIPIDIEMIDKFIPERRYSSDADLSTSQIICKEGYPSEAHDISTEDGYLLTLHRIPGKIGSPPVLLQHGLLGSSADWVIGGRNRALAFMLADNGYDVWMGNYRGNIYSRAHTNFSTADSRYWDFSWHEMGLYDIPAMILYITNLSQSNLSYAGFSMGTTGFYVMSSRRPDIASKVEIMFSLAPVAYMSYVKSPIRYLAPIARELQLIAHSQGIDEFLPENELVNAIAKRFCVLGNTERLACTNILFIICGYDYNQLDPELVPTIFGHTPAGVSTKTLVHYAQEVMSGEFQEFDYGIRENLRIYRSSKPPSYDASKITVPIALYYGANDFLANMKDVLRLSQELGNVIDLYQVPYQDFNHLDFLWAKHAPELIYNRLLSTLKNRVRSA